MAMTNNAKYTDNPAWSPRNDTDSSLQESVRTARTSVDRKQNISNDITWLPPEITSRFGSDLAALVPDVSALDGVCPADEIAIRFRLASAREAKSQDLELQSEVSTVRFALEQEAQGRAELLTLQLDLLVTEDTKLQIEISQHNETCAEAIARSGIRPPAVLNIATLTTEIEASAPGITQLAGQYEISLADSNIRESPGKSLVKAAAYAITGMFVALALGTIIGIVRPQDLRHGSILLIAGMAVLGSAVVVGFTSAIENAMEAYARYFVIRNAPGAPTLKGRPLVITALVALGLFLSGYVCLEARAVHDNYYSRKAEADFYAGRRAHTTEEPVPYIVFIMIGTVTTLPLSLTKALGALKRAEDELRLAFLQEIRRSWIVSKALELGTVYGTLAGMAGREARRRELAVTMREIQTEKIRILREPSNRLNEALLRARNISTGETLRLYQEIESAIARGRTQSDESTGRASLLHRFFRQAKKD